MILYPLSEHGSESDHNEALRLMTDADVVRSAAAGYGASGAPANGVRAVRERLLAIADRLDPHAYETVGLRKWMRRASEAESRRDRAKAADSPA